MNRGVAIGVDIGGTNTKIALVDREGRLRRQAAISTCAVGDPRPYFEQLLAIIAAFIREGSEGHEGPEGQEGSEGQPGAAGIGISTAGFLSPDRRTVEFNPSTPALVGVDYPRLLEPFGLPVSLEADLNAAALGEFAFGAGRGASRLVVGAIGTGLGAGVVLDGQLARFSVQMAGDTGHVILDPEGPRCTAGCRGCAEAFVSVAGVERAAARILASASEEHNFPLDGGRLTARAVIAGARAGHPLAARAMAEVGRWAGQWLASLSPIFLPERIVLCGGVAEAGEALLEPCRARFAELVGPHYHCQVVRGELGALAGVVGAATPFLHFHRRF